MLISSLSLFQSFFRLVYHKVSGQHSGRKCSGACTYRPVSLLSNMGKIMKALIADQMGFLTKYWLLDERQFGFR